jgi:galactonate dehydratase
LHKIVTLSSKCSIFTFGDAPLPEFDSSFFVLPPKDRAMSLVARYFDFAVPTHRFLHRPTVDGWVDSLYSNLGMMSETEGDRGKKAVTFMVFAQAQEYMSNNGTENSDCRSEIRLFLVLSYETDRRQRPLFPSSREPASCRDWRNPDY